MLTVKVKRLARMLLRCAMLAAVRAGCDQSGDVTATHPPKSTTGSHAAVCVDAGCGEASMKR